MNSAAGRSAERDQEELLGAISSDVDAYYTARVARHGATPLGVDWSCQATQALRFVQLLKLCDFTETFSLNDVGCGYGALVPYLAARHPGCEIDYLGIDLSRAMIGRARRRFAGPRCRFAVGAKSPRIADYSLASGIMNVNVGYSRQAWETFIASMLQQMHQTSRRGFAVNFMTAGPEEDTDERADITRLYRTLPERWMRFCEAELQCSVELISNYGMKEFTLLVRRDVGSASNTPEHSAGLVEMPPRQQWTGRQFAAIERAVTTLITPQSYARPDRLHRASALLRRLSPLHRVERPGLRPFRAVTRHADITAIEMRSQDFAVGPRTYLASEIFEAVLQRVAGKPQLVRSLTEMDPPDHSVYRAVIQPAFSPPSLRALQAWLTDWACEIVDEIAARDGVCDFARDVAVPFTFRVIGHMLGTPRADDARLARLAQGFVGVEDPFRQMAEAPGDALRVAMLGLRDYFETITADRRARPGDDLASLIANATPHGAPMPHYELISFFILMVTAGHDTAALALSGGLEALLAHPDQFARLREQPELLDSAIEEILRWTTPVRHFMRTALSDMEIGGRPIRTGETLALFFHSGNRDETVFEQADRFMVYRKSNPHIAFGRGPHICMGLHLARMEMRALLSELLRRTEQIVPAGRPRHIQSAFMGGVGALPVRLVFRAARG